MNNKSKAFSIVELLTVIAVISILLGLTLPALNEAKMQAKVMSVRADMKTLEMGLENFAGDMGFYPNSQQRPALVNDALPNPNLMKDQGAHILFEALVGLDQFGYQKDHFYGINPQGVPYKPGPPPRFDPVPTKRYDLYVQLDPSKVSSLDKCYPDMVWNNTNPVFVDTLDVDRPRPILYYRANKNNHWLAHATMPTIYEYADNYEITRQSPAFDPTFADNGTPWTIARQYFNYSIHNPDTGINIENTPPFQYKTARPYNPETYILISAGRDGVFGPNPNENYENDDIYNFQRK
ncbi:type II secretion system protein [Planctomycetota bacterium]